MKKKKKENLPVEENWYGWMDGKHSSICKAGETFMSSKFEDIYITPCVQLSKP